MINSSLAGILQDAIGRDHCRQVLLVSRVGTMVSSAAGDSLPLSPYIGPIVASTFSTGGELGRLLGIGEQNFQLRRGHRQDLLLCQMPSGMILVAAFPVRVDEERALAFASGLIDQIEALTPRHTPYADRPALHPELRDASLSLLDQLFPRAA